MSCEYCKSQGRTVCSIEEWENGFVRTTIRFYTGNNGALYLGADTITKDGQEYSTCKCVNFCPMCGEPLTEPEPLTLEQLRKMDGFPVWIKELNEWGLVLVDKNGSYRGKPFVKGRWFEYNVAKRRLTCFAHKPRVA